ncbi:hydroxypyruvate isomerase [Planctomycetales bacterium]|nr:hydroxypyruvate isomerase [Planctomycetales bacterium]
MLKTVAAGGLTSAAILTAPFAAALAQTADETEPLTVKGEIRQSVSKWCFNNIPFGEFCKICKKLGLVAIDLVDPKDWDTVLTHDLAVGMSNVPGANIGKGLNRLEHHEFLVPIYEKLIPQAAEKKVANLICFSGNCEGLDRETGLENCLVGLKKIMPTAEKYGVNIMLELLNSKGHKDYMADNTPWGGKLTRKLGSERFKLLYDIYHMQRMEGELIEMITNYKDCIGHYHTAGNPGRKDLDDQQEIYYPAVIRTIKNTGFKGFVAHEFSPKHGIQSLRDAVKTCDV